MKEYNTKTNGSNIQSFYDFLGCQKKSFFQKKVRKKMNFYFVV